MTSKKNNTQAKALPFKASELVSVALNDLLAVEKEKGYIVDMEYWHEVDDDTKKCRVCFAGSVMAKSLKVTKNKDVSPDSFDDLTNNQLSALDNFRCGSVLDGLSLLYGDSTSENLRSKYSFLRNRRVTPYNTSPQQFKKDMKELIKDLQKAGI
jgi:ribosomal protein S8